MKKKLLIVFVSIISVTSCLKRNDKDCSYDPCGFVAPPSEITAVQNYLISKSITATQHCSGLFYKIDTLGTGSIPGVCSSVTVNYKGTLTDGTVFDQQNNSVFFLGGVITGWKNGIPLIKSGGHIHLYIPPSLGYGNQQAGSVPPNSILIFDIALVGVQ